MKLSLPRQGSPYRHVTRRAMQWAAKGGLYVVLEGPPARWLFYSTTTGKLVATFYLASCLLYRSDRSEATVRRMTDYRRAVNAAIRIGKGEPDPAWS